MSVTITSTSRRQANRLSVTMTEQQYGDYLAKCGTADRARAEILNDAGRVEHHRAELVRIMSQVITDDQRRQVEDIASAYARQDALYGVIRDQMGYGTYVDRVLCGGMMPESWGQIVERARAEYAQDITDAYRVTDAHREHAMQDVGLYTERDRDWSHRVADWCDWQITRIAA